MREESAFYFTWSSFILLILCVVSFVAVICHKTVVVAGSSGVEAEVETREVETREREQ